MNGASPLPSITGRTPAPEPPARPARTAPEGEVAPVAAEDITSLETSIAAPEGMGPLTYRLDGRPAGGPPPRKGMVLDLKG